jgi:2-polyprenyl-3-methyl-5-hydroxy-6-metoxy-1,4-benzoquinol methylase
MFAFAMEQGSMFREYDGAEIGEWPISKPGFDGRQFDAIIAINFIEHIDDPMEFIRWAGNRATPGGQIFLEWPTPNSLHAPTSVELRTVGIDVMTGNYYDDLTHRDALPEMKMVRATLEESGFSIEETGLVRVACLENHIMALGKAKNDIVLRTLAYWSFTEWTQYVSARRV